MQARPPVRLATALAAFCILVAPSCLFGSKQRTTYRGQYVSQNNFSRLQSGASEEDVYDLFGEPTTKRIRGDNETWQYHYTQATTKGGAGLFLFAISSETEHEGTVSVEFVDAVVTRVTRS